MELFKSSKKQPIRLRGFDFVGFHNDYEYCCYYAKSLENDNFELMEMVLEGDWRKPQIGVGTKVQMLDTFMSNYLREKQEGITSLTEYAKNKEFITRAVEHSFSQLENIQKEGIVNKFTCKVPSQILASKVYKDFISKGYNILYCSNDESEEKKLGIVNLVLVKDEHLKSTDTRIDIDRHYTLFQPLKYMVTPGYLQDKSKTKYYEETLQPIVVNHDILK